jgi:hypothetical protein
MDDLGDRVLRPTGGPVGVARRVKAGLKDRLHDELEGHLDDAILERRDAQPTVSTVALGYQALADRQRPELARLQLAAQLRKEPLHATRFDVTASVGVDPGRP